MMSLPVAPLPQRNQATSTIAWDYEWRPRLMVVTMPLATRSEANSRDHWAVRARRVKEQRAQVLNTMRQVAGEVKHVSGARFHLTRLGKKRLDDDNLRSAFKAVRDALAEWVDIDDGHPSLTFTYGQQPGQPSLAIQVDAELSYLVPGEDW